MSDRTYRPEIDGLRAVSIMGVLLFHVGLGFPGGFVGVDVFFVISGYLITGILLRELRGGSFSLANFWVRRIRRIVPAAFAMVLATLAAGYFVLTPLAYQELGKTTIAQTLMVSNFVFAQQDGYFTESADFTPLLHTWSLAVEEQFYIIFPFLLWLAWKRLGSRPNLIFIIGAGIALGSFAWSVFTVSVDPKAAFFLLPARAWELLTGSALAAAQIHQRPRMVDECMSFVGLIFIFIAMLVYGQLTAFPGANALLPIAGAALFIHANQSRLTWCGRLLAVKPIVFIGLISYSLYLWHWPLLVFANHVFIERSQLTNWFLVVVSVLLGTLSWRFIETPFRKKNGRLSNRSSAFTFAAVTIAVSLAAASVISQGNGLAGRLSEADKQLLEDIDWRGDNYVHEDGSSIEIGATEGESKFALWGDSHGMAIAQAIDESAARHGLHGQAFLSAGVPPVTGLWFPNMGETERIQLLERNERTLKELIDSRVPNVLLVGRWMARCDGYNDAEMIDREPDYRKAPMVIDKLGDSPSQELSSRVLAAKLKAMLAKFEAAGIKVWLIRQVPESNHRDTAKLVAMAKRFPKTNELPQFSTSYEQHLLRQESSNEVFAQLSKETFIEVIDPSEAFFGESDRLKIYAGRSFYRDDDHLTRAGADHYMTPILDQIFQRIAGAAESIRVD